MSDEDFTFEFQGRPLSDVTGIIFIVIHYNRVGCLRLCLESLGSQLRSGDAIWFLDNGSDVDAQAHALSLFQCSIAEKFDSECCIVSSATRVNRSGAHAYFYVFNQLASKRFPSASHFVLLGDDDFLSSEWRNCIGVHLQPDDIITFGFNYFDWTSSSVVSAFNHSHLVSRYSTLQVFHAWLSRVKSFPGIERLLFRVKYFLNKAFRANICNDSSYPRQDHPSATLIPLSAVVKSSRIYATVRLRPYSDVAFILFLCQSKSVVYVDSPLVLIGRGCNYGMTKDVSLMSSNHPVRAPYVGFPSHFKYSAITYCECLAVLGHYDELLSVARVHLLRHYCTVLDILGFLRAIKLFFNFRCGPKEFDLRSDLAKDIRAFYWVLLSFVLPSVAERAVLLSLGIPFSSRFCQREIFITYLDGNES
jgi:hypothetical protein